MAGGGCGEIRSMALRSLISLAAAAAATAAACAVVLDAPNATRSGDDYASVPLPPGVALSDCSALCCDDAACVAFSFNDPQPSGTCVGPSCCAAGGVCCMLKNAVPPATHNTYGPSVRTGTVSRPPGPGPTPPFPPSTAITSVSFGPVRYWNGSGDTWPTAWAADGSVLGWVCDADNGGGFSPMGLWRLTGDPYSGPLAPTRVAAAPIDYVTLCAQYGKPSASALNVKPAGALALADGTLWTGVSCMNYGDDPGFNRQHNLGGFVARSVDGGATWANATAVGAFGGRFAAPAFLACGRANAACAGVVYAFFAAGLDGRAYWDNNDAVYLARVAESAVGDAAAYEYFAGTAAGVGVGVGGEPVWVPDAARAVPVISYPGMLGENVFTYHPVRRRRWGWGEAGPNRREAVDCGAPPCTAPHARGCRSCTPPRLPPRPRSPSRRGSSATWSRTTGSSTRRGSRGRGTRGRT